MTFEHLNRTLFITGSGLVAGFLMPVLPYAAICTVLIMTDLITAINLRRRLRRCTRQESRLQPELVSSAGILRAASTLVKVYAALLIAHGIDLTFTQDNLALRAVGAMVSFGQILSILENESSASNARWAAELRKYLIDKARRHMG